MNKLGGLGCLILVTVGALPACGGDDEKKDAPFSSGLSEKPLSQLTDTEVTKLCSDVGDYFVADPTFKSGTCRFSGVASAILSTLFAAKTDAELQKTCTDVESACMRAEGETTQEGTCQKPGATCTATMAEFEACVSDMRDSVSGALLSLPACNVLKRSDIGEPTAGGPTTTVLPEPESCKTLEQKCPGAAAGGGIPFSAENDPPAGQ